MLGQFFVSFFLMIWDSYTSEEYERILIHKDYCKNYMKTAKKLLLANHVNSGLIFLAGGSVFVFVGGGGEFF